MTNNQIKKSIKRILPSGVLNLIQSIRKIGYQPPVEIGILEQRYRQHQTTSHDLMTLRPGITVRIHPESRTPFEWFCFRSPEMVREFDRFGEQAKRFSTFADVGAHHGVFSLGFMALQPGGRVLSVDPSPVAFEILQSNRSLNSFDRMITCNVACGDTEGTVTMKRNWHHLEATVGPPGESGDIVSVQMVPLDSLCVEHQIQPELLKIDVEGFELPVLRGAVRTLESAKVLFLEIHPERIDEIGSSQSAIFDFLSQRGWCVRTLDGNAMSKEQFVDRIHTFWIVCTNSAPPS